MRQQIVNMTPHAVSIKLENGEMLVIPPSGQRAEVGNIYSHYHTNEDGVVFYTVAYGEPSALPASQWDADGWDFDPIYVVSSMYAAAIADQGRGDVFVPGEEIRDEAGRIVGCRGLARSGVAVPTPTKEEIDAISEQAIAASSEEIRTEYGSPYYGDIWRIVFEAIKGRGYTAFVAEKAATRAIETFSL